MATTLDQIRATASEAFGVELDKIEPESEFVDLTDDFGLVEFHIDADERYGLASATDEEFETAKTIGEFAALVDKHATRDRS